MSEGAEPPVSPEAAEPPESPKAAEPPPDEVTSYLSGVDTEEYVKAGREWQAAAAARTAAANVRIATEDRMVRKLAAPTSVCGGTCCCCICGPGPSPADNKVSASPSLSSHWTIAANS